MRPFVGSIVRRVPPLLVLITLFLAACSPQANPPMMKELPPPSPTVTIPPPLPEVRLGAVFPMSGGEAIPGGHYSEATQFFVRELNLRGGVKLATGLAPVKLTLLDDGTDREKSGDLVEELITRHRVHAVIGGYSSNLVQGQIQVPDRFGVPYVTGGAAASALYGHSKWVFGILSPVENLGRSQLEFLKDLIDRGKLPKPATIALAWERTDHGRDYRKGIFEATRANPDYFQVVLDEGFPLFSSDYTELLNKIRSANADLLMADSHLEDYISIHRQYSRMGLYHKMVTHGARGTDKAARDGLGAATDFVFSGVWTSPQLPYPQVQAFVDRYRRTNNRQPEWYHMAAYETVRVLVSAIERAGSVDPERIRAALASLELHDSLLPGGLVKFSPQGYAMHPYVITQNKPGGRVEVVWPPDARTGESVAPIPRS